MKTAGLLSIRQEKESKAKVSFFQDTAGRFSEFRENFKPGLDIPPPTLLTDIEKARVRKYLENKNIFINSTIYILPNACITLGEKLC